MMSHNYAAAQEENLCDKWPLKKHKLFVTSPMFNKPVTELPGIGPVNGSALNRMHIMLAYQVYEVFLSRQRQRELFISWLKEKTFGRIYENHARACYEALLCYFQRRCYHFRVYCVIICGSCCRNNWYDMKNLHSLM